MKMDWTSWKGRAAAWVAWSLGFAMMAGPLAAAPSFKIYLEKDGVYGVTYEDLRTAGLEEPLESGRLGLSSGDEEVPIWVEDGGDGVFGPGDRIEFVGEHLAGEGSYLNEQARFNVYFLTSDHPRPSRHVAGEMSRAAESVAARAYRSRQHLEEDLVILRLPPRRDGGSDELWYWHKLSHIAEEPFAQTLDLHDLDASSGGKIDLSLRFRGWSQPRDKEARDGVMPADHQVDVVLNGVPLRSAAWDGTAPYDLELRGLPAESWIAGDNRLEIRVPVRRVAREGRALIDVVMLNSIAVDYPRAESFQAPQASFELVAGGEDSRRARVIHDASRELVLYGEGGSRFSTAALAPAAESDAISDETAASFEPLPGEHHFWAAYAGELQAPHAVVPDRSSDWAGTDHQADYLMIAHRRLIEAVEPLAEFHRARGLSVAVVDIEDVYDEFGHGIARPQPLRDFVAHAYHRWQAPRPRFVLLVGDASWDAKNTSVDLGNYPALGFRPSDARRFAQVPSTPYARDAELNHRGLIPTWNHAAHSGHSASDNYFVAVDGDDGLPDLAIGRLPVVEPDEVAAIVAKTVAYASEPEVGPWRRNVLFITNESVGFQRRSDNLARDLAGDGFLPHKIYPASSEVSNEHHSRKLLETFNEGQLFVHFLGHGGRYIWRTGPPDLKKNHDLFTLDHLDELEASGRLPVVLSMTCYSAPFDHPNADSIGEKLLRVADRGAIAVLAASWRNSPSVSWGQETLAELTRPGATVGEAILLAKRKVRNRSFVETYNLLGDPALPVALPAGRVVLEASPGAGGAWDVRGEVELDDFAGRLLVDLVDGEGRVLETREMQSEDARFAAAFDAAPAARAVRVYAWNEARRIDAVGTLELAGQTGASPAAAGEESSRGTKK